MHRSRAESERDLSLEAKDLTTHINVVDIDENSRPDLVSVVCFFIILETVQDNVLVLVEPIDA